MAISLTYSSATIDFTGLELRVVWTYTGALPARGSVQIPDSVGIPDLRTSGNIRVALSYSIADWEIDRDATTATITGRYQIPVGSRIIKGASGYTVTTASGLIIDDFGNATATATAQSVTNNSEVNASGWADIDSHGYSAGSGHKTVYVDASRADDSGDGFSWAAAKKTAAAALTVLNAQTDNLPHRLLFANGQTYDDGSSTSTITRSGASRSSRLWIGGADKGDSNTTRPIWKRNQFWFVGTWVHVHGMEFQFGSGAIGNAACSLGKASGNASMQDCKFIFPQGLSTTANCTAIANRCIFTGDPGVGYAPIASGGVTNATLELSEIHQVNQRIGVTGGSGHGIYDIGRPASTDAVKTGCRTIQRDFVFLRNVLRDPGRARAETQFRSAYRVVSQDMGGSLPCGVGNSPITRTCTYNHATRTLTSNSTAFTSGYVIWAATYCYATSGTGVTPGKFQVASGANGLTTIVLSGAGLGAGADGSADVVVILGETSGRSRNQNLRHCFCINPGSFLSGFDVQYPRGLPTTNDVLGCWVRDCATTQQNATTNPIQIAPVPNTSDGDDIFIDMHHERCSIVRNQGNGLAFNMYGSISSLYTQTTSARFRKWIIDQSVINSTPKCFNKIANTDKASFVFDYNVYSGPSVTAGWIHTDTHASTLQTLATWRSATSLDANSVQLTTVELNGSTSAYPNLADYDLQRASISWGESGTVGTTERLANAMASRPLGYWDEVLNAPTIVPWVLKTIKPTSTGSFPSGLSGDYDYFGAADHTLPVPTGLATSLSTPTTFRLSWTASASSKVQSYVVRYGNSSGALDNETTVYLNNYIDLAGVSGTVYYTVTASDGWNKSDASSEGSIALGAIPVSTSARRLQIRTASGVLNIGVG